MRANRSIGYNNITLMLFMVLYAITLTAAEQKLETDNRTSRFTRNNRTDSLITN